MALVRLKDAKPTTVHATVKTDVKRLADASLSVFWVRFECDALTSAFGQWRWLVMLDEMVRLMMNESTDDGFCFVDG